MENSLVFDEKGIFSTGFALPIQIAIRITSERKTPVNIGRHAFGGGIGSGSSENTSPDLIWPSKLPVVYPAV